MVHEAKALESCEAKLFDREAGQIAIACKLAEGGLRSRYTCNSWRKRLHKLTGVWACEGFSCSQLQPVAACFSILATFPCLFDSFWYVCPCALDISPSVLSSAFFVDKTASCSLFMLFFSCSLFFLMSLFIGGFRHRQTQTQPAWPKLVTGALPPFNPNVWSWRTVLPRPDHMCWKQGIKWHQETHLDGNHALVSFVCKNNLTNKKWWIESLPSWSMDSQKLVAD